MHRPWQSKEMGCQLSPLHGGTAYQCSIQLPYGVPNTKHEVQDKKQKSKPETEKETGMNRKEKENALKEIHIHRKVRDGNTHIGLLEAFCMENAMEDGGALRLMVEEDFFN